MCVCVCVFFFGGGGYTLALHSVKAQLIHNHNKFEKLKRATASANKTCITASWTRILISRTIEILLITEVLKPYISLKHQTYATLVSHCLY